MNEPNEYSEIFKESLIAIAHDCSSEFEDRLLNCSDVEMRKLHKLKPHWMPKYSAKLVVDGSITYDEMLSKFKTSGKQYGFHNTRNTFFYYLRLFNRKKDYFENIAPKLGVPIYARQALKSINIYDCTFSKRSILESIAKEFGFINNQLIEDQDLFRTINLLNNIQCAIDSINLFSERAKSLPYTWPSTEGPICVSKMTNEHIERCKEKLLKQKNEFAKEWLYIFEVEELYRYAENYDSEYIDEVGYIFDNYFDNGYPFFEMAFSNMSMKKVNEKIESLKYWIRKTKI